MRREGRMDGGRKGGNTISIKRKVLDGGKKILM